VPEVQWRVAKTESSTVGKRGVVAKQLVGHVDNSSWPQIQVEIQMTLVLPANSVNSVPVMILFGRGGMPQPNDPPATRELIEGGWGYAYISPSSIQADNGAGLTQGIIGLVNRGQPRKPEDWGALRAWAWGASRALYYLQTEKGVNAKLVGIEGVSRF